MSNVVPDGWNNKIFADAITLSYGKSPKEIFAEDGTYPVVGTGGITGYTNHYLHEGYTTVVGRKGSINNPSFFSDKFWAIDTTYYASNYKDTDAKWFFYLLQSIDLTKYNEASGVPSLNRDTLYSISFIAPPLPEQQKIAAILTSVDEVIEKTQAQINKLKDLKTGMMQELLTRGVGIDGKPHTEFKDSPVGRIPKGWNVVTIGDLLKTKVISSIQDGNHGAIHPKSADFVSDGIPFVMASDLHNGRIDFEGSNKIPEDIYNKLRIGFAQSGDVLLSHKATVGLTAIVPCGIKHLMLTPQVTYYRLGDSSKLFNIFLFYVFQSGYFQKTISLLSAQSTRSYIGILAQRELEIALPNTLKEQKQIVSILQSIDKRIDSVSDKLKLIKNIKKALMQDLLTGKVRVNVD